MEYQRGDSFTMLRKLEEKLSPKEVIARGTAMEDMVKSDGWKYLADWMQIRIDVSTDGLINMNNVDMNEVSDLRCILQIYKGILKKPIEFINDRNKLQK